MSILFDKRLNNASITKGISSHFIIDKIVELILKYKRTGTILDFGAGVGNLTALINSIDQFSEIHAVDIMSPPNSFSQNIIWKVRDLNFDLPYENSRFDNIVSPEVIEHLENPRFIAREWFRVLRKDGMIFFSTPNNHSFRSIISFIMRHHFAGFNKKSYPAHITALTKVDMFRILNEAGFSNIKFYFYKCWWSAWYSTIKVAKFKFWAS